MTESSKNRIVNVISVVVAAVLLALVFTLPGMYLNDFASAMDTHIGATREAVYDGDWTSAASELRAMEALIESSSMKLKIFLDHEDVDRLKLTVYTAASLAAIEDEAELIIELELASNITQYLVDIETLSLHDLF